ncbi:ERF family protein [Pseudomonas sp. 6D_7.1_Bac1]|uniref:ERF family protein n=1 Tax=Pseudomonas sp. 6D_7.1_Bac1 TaxID=2971615 RepID=UPI0021C6C7BE|nr:ERF family protein [Pseudomonas sp. 6D_7.1_Bac1]MCU1752185.1 ERF family protein [Pseudomonas sp. 6D_7.1_Bac1]
MPQVRKLDQAIEPIEATVVTTIDQHRPPTNATAVAAQGNDAASIMSVIMQVAATPNVDVGNMERLMQMHERHVDRQASAAFSVAMVNAQKRIKPVTRKALNKHTASTYARLEDIDREISPIFTEEGFSLSFGTADSRLPGHLRITCDCMHAGGHTKLYQLDLPIDAAGSGGKTNKTGVQANGSTISYGRRYLTQMIFNVTTTDDDDDGNSGAPPTEALPPEPEALPPYPPEKFTENFPKWVAMILSGQKTAEHIVVMLGLKASLTEHQKKTILAIIAPSQEGDAS